MSVNKKALTRYLAYDKCLRNTGRKWSWNDLRDAANRALENEGLEGIGKTQFYADMQYMECSELKAPIDKYKVGRAVYFRYSDPHYTITDKPLNETEIQQLNAALQVLLRMNGLPQFEWVNEVVPAIRTKLGISGSQKEVMTFENNLDYEGLKFIPLFFNAIVNKRVVRVCYQDFRSPFIYELDFHPYHLRQFNNRWFAFGYNPARQQGNWNIALDRVQSIEEVALDYHEDCNDWNQYFSDFIGVSKREGKPEEVRLLIRDKEQAAYIKTKPLHETQKPIKETEGGYETSIKVIPNYELERLLLSYGERIEVLSPSTLRERIADRYLKAGGNYQQK